MHSVRRPLLRLAGFLTSTLLAGAALATNAPHTADVGSSSPRTRPALFDAMHKAYSAKADIKPGETAAVLLRVAQVACPSHPQLSRLDPSRLRYAALGGFWLQERLAAPALRSDSAPWHIRAFLTSIEDSERGGFQVDGLNLRAKGLQCSVEASEVAWLDDRVAALPAQHLRQGKLRLEQAGIPELPPLPRTPPRPVDAPAGNTPKDRLKGFFPSYFKARPAPDGRMVYAAQDLERTLHGHEGVHLIEHEAADAFCLFQRGQAFSSMERVSRGVDGYVTEYGANFTCDNIARGARDKAVLELAGNYNSYNAKLVASGARGRYDSIIVFGSLGREQAHTMVRWSIQSAVATARTHCLGQVTIKSIEFWLLDEDRARDAAVTVETLCAKSR